jgi:NADH:ubiquinone oxidoreductase subunit
MLLWKKYLKSIYRKNDTLTDILSSIADIEISNMYFEVVDKKLYGHKKFWIIYVKVSWEIRKN